MKGKGQLARFIVNVGAKFEVGAFNLILASKNLMRHRDSIGIQHIDAQIMPIGYSLHVA